MGAYTVSSIIERAKSRCDQVGSGFVSPAEWLDWFNDGYKDLYRLLSDSFEDYFTEPTPITVSADVISLPATFYKFRDIEKDNGGVYKTLKKGTLKDRNNRSGPLCYILTGSKIYLRPTDQAAGNYQLWSVPLPTDKLLADTVSTQIVQWDAYIIAQMARKAMVKQELDSSAFDAEIVMITAQIKEEAKNRDLTNPRKIRDVRTRELYPGEFYLYEDEY